MDKKDRLGLRTWIEIDKGAIKANFESFRDFIPKRVKMLGVVKSNAYGHNLIEFAKELETLGVDFLGVDSVVEGLALRREGVKTPILILGYTLPEMIERAVDNDLEITVSNFDYFSAIKKLNLKKEIRVHIKVDTGMHRHGFQKDDVKKVIKLIKENKKIKVVGLFTHFANAKNPAFLGDTKKQTELFNKWREAFKKAGINPICHACATSGTILFPEAHFDMVRIGIGMYGVWPSQETEAFAKDKIKLTPALSWKTVIGEINDIKAGERIGYDFTEKLMRDSKVAVLPIGYWHGYPRALSGIGQVLVNGKYAKVLGRICMDIIMVDVTKIKGVKVGDEVVIIGSSGKETVATYDISFLIGRSDYEIITTINPLIKKIYK
jgi:alanine racemase